MHAEFWQARWARSEIGFHLSEVNPYLQRYWPALGLPEGARVLVPLCGKSLDLAWLVGQGYQVVGVELAPRAVEDFFTEHGCNRRSVMSEYFGITKWVAWRSIAGTSLPSARSNWTVAPLCTTVPR